MKINSSSHLNYYQNQKIQHLKEIDAKVKAHEQAHLSAAGGIAIGGAHYKYVTGPDGKKYAVAGDVNILVEKGKTPKETIQKMQQVIAAALAPADPSMQDLKVAQQASEEISKAMQKLNSKHIDIKA